MALVKHGKRTIRKPCNRCGRGKPNGKDAGLYWAHDTDRPHDGECAECGINGKFTLIESDGSRHDCGSPFDRAESTDETPQKSEDPAPWDTPDEVSRDPRIEAPKEVPTVSASAPATVPAPDAVQTALATLMGALSPQVGRAEIEAMVKEAVANVVFPTRTVIERANGDVKQIEGSTHHRVADVTTLLLAGEHVLMVGPAGTGKGTIAEHAAEALGLKYYSISLSPQTPASQLLGYMQATGDYVSTLFREAYENGGIFHFDEFDNGHPSTLAVVNAALANGRMAFPDRMVKRHPDFRSVASANTYGRGATRAYVGRQALDAATLDRFSVLTIDVDEALESELSHATGLETDQVARVLKFVRKARTNAEKHVMPVVVSPRASVGMCRLLAAGMSWESAVDSRLRRGLGDTEWNKLIA